MWTSGISRLLLKAQSLSAPRILNVSLPSAIDKSTNGRLFQLVGNHTALLLSAPCDQMKAAPCRNPLAPVRKKECFGKLTFLRITYANFSSAFDSRRLSIAVVNALATSQFTDKAYHIKFQSTRGVWSATGGFLSSFLGVLGELLLEDLLFLYERHRPITFSSSCGFCAKANKLPKRTTEAMEIALHDCTGRLIIAPLIVFDCHVPVALQFVRR